MNAIKIFLLIMACFCPLICEAQQMKNEISSALEYEVVDNKVYIQPDQLFITSEGIFLFVQGVQVLVNQLNCDDHGIYCLVDQLDTITDKCKNGHKIWCKRCFGCVVRECLFHCKCVEWKN